MSRSNDDRRDAAIGWALWAVLLLVVSGLQAAGDLKSVTPAYAKGCRAWLEGGDLYSGDGHGFLYLPISAVILSPLALVPGAPIEIAWRAYSVVVFAVGCRVLARHVGATVGRPAFALTSVLGVVLAFSAARNGQATLSMAGFLMLAVSAAVANRLPAAAVAATCALAMKPLALPVVMVIGACRPRIVPFLVLGLLGLLAAPYLCADAAWVTRQYVGFLETLARSKQMGVSGGWATFFGMFHVFGLAAPDSVRLAVQLGTAVAVAVAGRVAARRLDPHRAALHVYSLSMLWLLLFSPRTENNTYACLAPALAWLMAFPRDPARGDLLRAGGCAAAGIAVVGSYELGRLVTPGIPGVWLAPAATTLLALAEAWRFMADRAVETPGGGAQRFGRPPCR